MNYYAVQVWTGKEDEFADRLAGAHAAALKPLVPKRAVMVRRKKKNCHEEKPLFPGYVFLGIDSDELGNDQRWHVRATKFFLRFLPTTIDPLPVKEQDRRLLAHFMSFGKVADISKVTFDDYDRIVVVEGPLKGLEGKIIKVNVRKRRAKIRLDMCENSFLIDLGFEIIDRAVKGPGDSDGQQARES